MTSIGGVTIDKCSVFKEDGYSVTITGWLSTQLLYNELREACALCDTTTAQWVPGRKPLAYDPTEDQVNIVYIVFTTGLKARSGFYLLNSFSSFEDDSTKGLHYYFEMSATFLGTLATLSLGYDDIDLDEVASDWSI